MNNNRNDNNNNFDKVLRLRLGINKKNILIQILIIIVVLIFAGSIAMESIITSRKLRDSLGTCSFFKPFVFHRFKRIPFQPFFSIVYIGCTFIIIYNT